jgi:hypothetical protein
VSTVRANNYYDASGGSNAQLYGVASPPNSMGFRNRILNGGMVIDQRNAGAAVTGQQYVVDRWRTWFDPGTYSFQQITDAPTGFTNSLRVTKTNTTQSNYAFLVQYIEGLNCADFAWGSASAQTVTISFWVKSSITGAFTVALSNSAENRFYGTTYTINAANTWEQKSVTIAGDTSGTWLTTNGIGIQVMFNFGQAATAQAANAWTTSSNARAVTGSTSLGTTNNATWQITGVQLEAGTVASPFERRDYGRELMMCQRYYQVIETVSDLGAPPFIRRKTDQNIYVCSSPLPVRMRAAATVTYTFTNVHKPGNSFDTFGTVTVEGNQSEFFMQLTPTNNETTATAAYARTGGFQFAAEL